MSDTASSVADDPFWSVVRERHPELDVVILPRPASRVEQSARAERASAPFLAGVQTTTDQLWAQLVGHGMPTSETRWVPGPTNDSVRCTVTLTLIDVTSAVGIAHVRDAEALLVGAGWQVFTPPIGTPRVLAQRTDDLGAEDLLFGYSVETGRIFARLTSAALPVGARRAHDLIGSAHV